MRDLVEDLVEIGSRIHILKTGIYPAHRQAKIARKILKLRAKYQITEQELHSEWREHDVIEGWNWDDNCPYPDVPEEGKKYRLMLLNKKPSPKDDDIPF